MKEQSEKEIQKMFYILLAITIAALFFGCIVCSFCMYMRTRNQAMSSISPNSSLIRNASTDALRKLLSQQTRSSTVFGDFEL